MGPDIDTGGPDIDTGGMPPPPPLGGPHGPGVEDPELPAGLPTNPCGPDAGPQGTSWGGPPPGVWGGPGDGPVKEPAANPGVPGPGIIPVGVAGPGGVLKVGVVSGPPGPPGPKCPFQPGTGSSSVLANVMTAVLGLLHPPPCFGKSQIVGLLSVLLVTLVAAAPYKVLSPPGLKKGPGVQ